MRKPPDDEAPAPADDGVPADADAGAVQLVVWPSDAAVLEGLAVSRTPRLVLVEEGHDPPLGSDCCQDWMWRTGTERELRARVWQVALRALSHRHDRPRLDRIGLLRVGLRSVHLSPKEQALIEPLLEHFNDVVPVDQLIAAAWPNGIRRHNVLATRISALRSRLAGVGLDIEGSSSTGYTLRPAGSVIDVPDAGCFDEEFDGRRWLRRRD